MSGMCYRLDITGATSFSLAEDACEAEGASLLTLETEEKLQALLKGGLFESARKSFVTGMLVS